MYTIGALSGGGYHNLDIDGDAGLIMESNNPLDFKFGKSMKTYTVKILNTPENNLRLDNLFNKNYYKTLGFTALANIDGITFRGMLYVHSHNDMAADAQFVCGNGAIWASVRDKNLRDFFDWAAYDHSLTYANVISSSLAGGDLRYDFVYRGDGLQTQGLTPMKDVDICERLPGVKVQKIFEKIFAGYTITQNFLTSTQWGALFLLFTAESNRNSKGWLKTAVGTINSKSNLILDPKTMKRLSGDFFSDIDEYYRNRMTGVQYASIDVAGGHWSEVFNDFIGPGAEEGGRLYYAIPENGAYAFMGTIKINLSTNITQDLEIVQNWTGRKLIIIIDEVTGADVKVKQLLKVIHALSNESTTGYYQISDLAVNIPMDSKIVELTGGNKIRVQFRYEISTVLAGGDPVPTVKIVKTKLIGHNFKVLPFQGYGQSASILGKDIMPNITAGKFVEMICGTFNVEINGSLEKKEIFLTNRQVTLPDLIDLTIKVIAGSVKAETNPLPSDYKFSFTADVKDKNAIEQVVLLGENDGSKEVGSYGDGDGVVQITSPFSFNYMRDLVPICIQMTTAFVNESDKDYAKNFAAGTLKRPSWASNFNYRLAFLDGTVSYTHNLHYNTGGATGGGTSTARTTFPKFSNAISGISIDFSAAAGLYATQWSDLIERLIDGTVLTCDLLLENTFVNSLYYLNNPDFRNNFSVDIPNYRGVYQILQLLRKSEGIYSAKMLRVLNYASGEIGF